ncbi:hypothetical protein Emed_007642 [Eimeria media]
METRQQATHGEKPAIEAQTASAAKSTTGSAQQQEAIEVLEGGESAKRPGCQSLKQIMTEEEQQQKETEEKASRIRLGKFQPSDIKHVGEAKRILRNPATQEILKHKELLYLHRRLKAYRALRGDMWRIGSGRAKLPKGREWTPPPPELATAFKRTLEEFPEPSRLFEIWSSPFQKVDRTWDLIFLEEFPEVVGREHWEKSTWKEYLTPYSRDFLAAPSCHVKEIKHWEPKAGYEPEIPNSGNTVKYIQDAIKALGGNLEEGQLSPLTAASTPRRARGSLQEPESGTPVKPLEGSETGCPAGVGKVPVTPSAVIDLRISPSRMEARDVPVELVAIVDAWAREHELGKTRLEDMQKVEGMLHQVRLRSEGELRRLESLRNQSQSVLALWHQMRSSAMRSIALAEEKKKALREVRELREELLKLKAATGKQASELKEKLHELQVALEKEKAENAILKKDLLEKEKLEKERLEKLQEEQKKKDLEASRKDALATRISDPKTLQMLQSWWKSGIEMAEVFSFPLPELGAAEKDGSPQEKLVRDNSKSVETNELSNKLDSSKSEASNKEQGESALNPEEPKLLKEKSSGNQAPVPRNEEPGVQAQESKPTSSSSKEQESAPTGEQGALTSEQVLDKKPRRRRRKPVETSEEEDRPRKRRSSRRERPTMPPVYNRPVHKVMSIAYPSPSTSSSSSESSEDSDDS